MKKSSLLAKLTRQDARSLEIARVNDLLNAGVSRRTIADDFVRINREVWGNLTSVEYLWTHEKLQQHFSVCPEYIYCAFENGRMVGTLTSIRTTEEAVRFKNSWLAKTGTGCLTTHAPDGPIGFGVDLSITKSASRAVSQRIVLVALFLGVLGESLQAVYLGARIPGYHRHRHLPVRDYVYGRTKNGKPRDPELYFYLKSGFEIVEILPDYMEDPQSLNYGVLLKWANPLYLVTRRAPFVAAGIKRIGEALLVRVPASLERDVPR